LVCDLAGNHQVGHVEGYDQAVIGRHLAAPSKLQPLGRFAGQSQD
jgi:hypothetical protein